jgi:hypothetical protein
MKPTITKIAATLTVAAIAVVPMVVSGVDLDLGVNYGANTGLGSRDVRDTAATVINVLLSLLGIIALVIILAGGAMWMMAGGDDAKVQKARALMGAGAIGMVIILAAFAIARFIVDSLQNATGN